MFRNGAVLVLVILLSAAQPLMVLASDTNDQVNDQTLGPRAVQYLNFSDDTNAWQNWFSPVTWPSGPFRQVTLTVTLHNKGDTYDRATAIGVNNVTLILMTTKEWVGGTQVFSRDVTLFQDVFKKPSSEVEWDPGLPSYMGGWTGNLTFAFYPGTPALELPKVLPAFYIRYVDRNGGNKTNATVLFPPGTQRATAVLSEEGFGSSDEFWFGNSAVKVRDFQCIINATTVFDITGQPYVNSGGALGGVMGDLYEWNATPPPGDGLRPLHMVNITPMSYLLNGTKNVTLAINEGQDFWWLSLTFLLYGPADSVPFEYQNHVVQRNKISSTQLTIFTSAWSTRPATNGQETLFVNYSSWLNSSSTVEVHEVSTVSRFLATATVFIVMENVVDTVFNFTVDTANGKAVDVYYIQTWTNTTKVWGNGQNSSRTDSYQDYEFIDGSSGGSRVKATHRFTHQDLGNLTHMDISWNVTDIRFQNVTGTNGIAKNDTPASEHFTTGTVTPFPALFFINPVPDQPVTGTVDIKFAFTNQTLKTASLEVNGNPTDLTGLTHYQWDTASLSNGNILLKTIGTDGTGTQHVNIIRVFKGVRPTVLSTNPLDNTSLVPQDKAVSIKFSMSMSKASTESAFSISPFINGSSFSWNNVADTLTWNHTELFKNDTIYSVMVHGNATNSYGVDMRMDFAFSFRTWKPPFITSILPRPGAVNVTRDESVRLTFSVPMKKNTVATAFSISPSVGNVSYATDLWQKNITWSHTDLFARNTTYHITLGPGCEAMDGTPMGSTFTFNFSTVDPPKVLTLSPADGATKVRLDAVLSVNFSSSMDKDSIETGFSITPPVAGVFVWYQGSSSFSWEHATDLVPNITYNITIVAIRDHGGIPMEANLTWSFKTAPRPFVVSNSPTEGMKDVDIFEPVRVSFSEPMDLASVENGFSIDPTVAGEFSWTGVHELVWSHYKEGFTPGTQYTLTIESSAFSTLGVPVLSQFVLTFTTAARPALVNTIPVGGGTSIPIGAVVWMTFNLPMNKSSVADSLTVDPVSNISIIWANATKVELLPIAPLEPKTLYTFTIGAKAMSMKNASIGTDFKLSFRTGEAPDTTPPTIKSITPLNETQNVAPQITIVVVFSEPMNKNSVEKAFKVTADNKSVPGTILWNSQGDIMSFFPSVVLPKGAMVLIMIGSPASDLAGNHLTAERDSWFLIIPKPKSTSSTSSMPLMAGGIAAVVAIIAVVLAVFMIKKKAPKEKLKVKKETKKPKKV